MSISAASGMNNTVPGNIQPNTGSSGDGSLATALSYTPFLGVSSAVSPNASTAASTYDSAGRISSTQTPSHTTDGSVAGATTNYVYAFGTTVGGNITNGAYTTTATTGTHWATSVTDGLGRTASQVTGFGSLPRQLTIRATRTEKRRETRRCSRHPGPTTESAARRDKTETKMRRYLAGLATLSSGLAVNRKLCSFV